MFGLVGLLDLGLAELQNLDCGDAPCHVDLHSLQGLPSFATVLPASASLKLGFAAVSAASASLKLGFAARSVSR